MHQRPSAPRLSGQAGAPAQCSPSRPVPRGRSQDAPSSCPQLQVCTAAANPVRQQVQLGHQKSPQGEGLFQMVPEGLRQSYALNCCPWQSATLPGAELARAGSRMLPPTPSTCYSSGQCSVGKTTLGWSRTFWGCALGRAFSLLTPSSFRELSPRLWWTRSAPSTSSTPPTMDSSIGFCSPSCPTRSWKHMHHALRSELFREKGYISGGYHLVEGGGTGSPSMCTASCVS